jgi:hypothetical protein
VKSEVKIGVGTVAAIGDALDIPDGAVKRFPDMRKAGSKRTQFAALVTSLGVWNVPLHDHFIHIYP